MEKADRELIVQLAPEIPELKKLVKQHEKLDKQITRFEAYSVYSASAGLRCAQLKKEKLKTKDEIMTVLDGFRHEQRVANLG